MKLLIVISFALSFSLFSFSQNKIAEVGKILQQDNSKPKSSGTQSNLSVSDEGKGGTKGYHSSNKSASSPATGGTGSSSIAVSDEGSSVSKGKSSSREAKDPTKASEPKKAEMKTAAPKE